MPLLKCPPEIHLMILGYLKHGDLARIARTVRRLRRLALDTLYEKDAQESQPKALLWAVEHGQLSTLERSLKTSKTNLDSQETSDGITASPLHIAAKHGHDHLIGMLLEHGAKIEAESSGLCSCLPWAEESSSRWSPLHIAICFKKLPAAKLLISWGADLNNLDKCNGGITAMHTAVSVGFYSMIKEFPQLLEDSRRKRTDSGQTLLHYATRCECEEIEQIIELLRDKRGVSERVPLKEILTEILEDAAEDAREAVPDDPPDDAQEAVQNALVDAIENAVENALEDAPERNPEDAQEDSQEGAQEDANEAAQEDPLVLACRHLNFRVANLLFPSGEQVGLESLKFAVKSVATKALDSQIRFVGRVLHKYSESIHGAVNPSYFDLVMLHDDLSIFKVLLQSGTCNDALMRSALTHRKIKPIELLLKSGFDIYTEADWRWERAQTDIYISFLCLAVYRKLQGDGIFFDAIIQHAGDMISCPFNIWNILWSLHTAKFDPDSFLQLIDWISEQAEDREFGNTDCSHTLYDLETAMKSSSADTLLGDTRKIKGGIDLDGIFYMVQEVYGMRRTPYNDVDWW